ncbi:MAG: hypothetical protein PHF47_01550 [Bacilli bacterium]|nr:hypothetical protein [Bacilli bacterium]
MKRLLVPIILGSLLIGVGIVLMAYDFSHFTYSNQEYQSQGECTIETATYRIGAKRIYIKVYNSKYRIIEDNTLDDKFMVITYYNPDVIKLLKTERENVEYRDLGFGYQLNHHQQRFYQEIITALITSINDRKIYNYDTLFFPYLEIKVNVKDRTKLKVLSF